MPKLAEKYFEAGRKTADGKRSPKALHRFRIATKRFRYALELFRPIYGPNLDRRLKSLRALQDVLGKVSDYQTIRILLKGDKTVRKKLEQSLARKTKEFRKQWKAFDSSQQLRQWKTYLAHGRPRPKRPSPRQKN